MSSVGNKSFSARNFFGFSEKDLGSFGAGFSEDA